MPRVGKGNKQSKKTINNVFSPTRKYTYKSEEQAFVSGKGVLECPDCHIYFYKKAWHNQKPKEPVTGMKLCPASEMKHQGEYAGMLRIDKVPAQYQNDLVNLILHMDREAQANNPLHRILSLTQKSNNDIEIKVSEDQLVQRLAKKIMATHKNAFSKKESITQRNPKLIFIELNWVK